MENHFYTIKFIFLDHLSFLIYIDLNLVILMHIKLIDYSFYLFAFDTNKPVNHAETNYINYYFMFIASVIVTM